MTISSEPTNGLTLQDLRVANAYIETQSYQKAGEIAGYTGKYARNTAYKRLQKENVRSYVRAKLEEIRQAENVRLTPERIKAKIAEKAFNDGLKPEVQLKALELAGKATPGTFEPSAPSGPTFNVFNVLAKLATVAPSAYIDVATSTPSISTPTTSAAPLPPAVDPVAVAHSPSDAPTFSSAPGDVATPQAGGVYSDTTTPKFVAQKKEELTPVVGEKLQGEQTPSGGDGLAEGPASGGAA